MCEHSFDGFGWHILYAIHSHSSHTRMTATSIRLFPFSRFTLGLRSIPKTYSNLHFYSIRSAISSSIQVRKGWVPPRTSELSRCMRVSGHFGMSPLPPSSSAATSPTPIVVSHRSQISSISTSIFSCSRFTFGLRSILVHAQSLLLFNQIHHLPPNQKGMGVGAHPNSHSSLGCRRCHYIAAPFKLFSGRLMSASRFAWSRKWASSSSTPTFWYSPSAAGLCLGPDWRQTSPFSYIYARAELESPRRNSNVGRGDSNRVQSGCDHRLMSGRDHRRISAAPRI